MKIFKNSITAKVVTGFLGLALAAVVAAPAVASAIDTTMMSSSYTFTKTLKMGMSDQEVMNLQSVLNASADTMVSASGVGSKGMETKYFGAKTKMAVVKFQEKYAADILTPNGLTKGTGMVGAATRAKLNTMGGMMTGGSSMLPGCTSMTGYSMTTGMSCAGGMMTGGLVMVPGCTGVTGFSPTTGMSCASAMTGDNMGAAIGTGVTVSALANPNGSIVSGSAQVPVVNFRIANGTGADVTVNGLKFLRTGILSDSNITNAYLASGNTIVAQYSGVTNGVVTFTGSVVTIPAGKVMDLNLRVDISSAASAGNLLAFQLTDASMVSLSTGTTVGTFPILGGSYTVGKVSNPDLAQISNPTYQAVASEVDAGTLGFRSSAMSFTVLNSPIALQSVRYTVSGSVNLATDLQNLKLRLDGRDVATATTVDNTGHVVFVMASSSVRMNTGSHQLEVYADVLGTPNRNFKFEILRPYDWALVDTQYNTNISGGTPSGTNVAVSVRQGTATLSLASDTPTGNLPRGGSNVTIAKFTIRASGEALRIKWMPFMLTQSGTSSWATLANVDTDVRNIAIYADDGTQLGTTINTPSSCTYGGATVTGGTVYTCSVGSPSSNINYTIPANTTRVFSLKADIQQNGTMTSIKGALISPTGSAYAGSNVEGQISFQTSVVPGGIISGSNLSISASPFTGSQNSAFSGQSYVGGANAVKIASFSVGASSAETINLTSVTIKTSAAVNGGGLNAQNLIVKVGANTWNYNVPTISGGTSYTFSSPSGTTMIPAGGNILVDVYADVLTGSTALLYTAPISLAGAVGIGSQTNSNQILRDNTAVLITTSAPVAGQSLTVVGTGSLTTTIDTSLPPSQQIVLGATGVSLGQFRFTAGNNEDMKVDQFTVTASSTATTTAPATFKNLALYDVTAGNTSTGAIAIGTSLTGANGVYTSIFSIPSNPLIVAKNTTRTYVVRGDVSTFTESTNSSNQSYTFAIATTSDVRSFGNQSNVQTTVLGNFPLVANVQTTLRTKLTAQLVSTGVIGGRVRTATDDIANLTLNADVAYGVEFKSVNFTMSGAALNFTGTTVVQLVDNETGIAAATTTLVTTSGSSTAYTVTLTLPAPYLITQGTSKIFKVRVSSALFNNVVSSADGLSTQIGTANALVWQTQGLVETLGLQTKDVPITATVSYD